MNTARLLKEEILKNTLLMQKHWAIYKSNY
jgi:hypothetical protein